MRKTSTNLLVILIAIFAFTSDATAQQIPQSRKWVAKDAKYVKFGSTGIHFLPRDVKEGPDSVTTALHLTSGQPWKITFDVQMTPAANGGMSVYLFQGAKELGWIGAGDFYKYLSGFLGSGNSNMPFNQPWDSSWHSFTYMSDGNTLSLWHNGGECGETSLVGTPNIFTIQSIGIDLKVRNVSVETLSSNVTVAQNLSSETVNKNPSINHKTLHIKHRRGAKSVSPKHSSLAPSAPYHFASAANPKEQTSWQNSQKYTSAPSEDLKRMAEDYQNQIIATKDQGKISIAASNVSMSAMDVEAAGGSSSKQESDAADAEYKKYQQCLRDLVTAFAMLRAVPGYSKYYIETGYVFNAGDTDNIPGVAGLKNIVAR